MMRCRYCYVETNGTHAICSDCWDKTFYPKLQKADYEIIISNREEVNNFGEKYYFSFSKRYSEQFGGCSGFKTFEDAKKSIIGIMKTWMTNHNTEVEFREMTDSNLFFICDMPELTKSQVLAWFRELRKTITPRGVQEKVNLTNFMHGGQTNETIN